MQCSMNCWNMPIEMPTPAKCHQGRMPALGCLPSATMLCHGYTHSHLILHPHTICVAQTSYSCAAPMSVDQMVCRPNVCSRNGLLPKRHNLYHATGLKVRGLSPPALSSAPSSGGSWVVD